MDLKKYAGKNVCIQFKQGNGWYVMYATNNPEAAPRLMKSEGPSGNPVPVVYPFIEGIVQEDGSLIVDTSGDTANGGKLRMDIDPDVILMVCAVEEPSVAPSQIVTPGSPQIVTPN